MLNAESYRACVAQAVAGHAAALEALLRHHRHELESYLQRHWPAKLRVQIDPQDLFQDVCFEAFRRVRAFDLTEADAFGRWLLTIARHRLIDTARALRTAKRGGDRRQIHPTEPTDSTSDLLVSLRAYLRTPSDSALSHEMARIVRDSLTSLPTDQRQTLQMRFLEEVPVAQIARSMHRSEGAVHMLCDRSLKTLRRHLAKAIGVSVQ